MELSPLVLQWREEALQEGMRAERRTTTENLLRVRFGFLDAQLSTIIEPILELQFEEFTRLILQLSDLSREEVLAKFEKRFV